MDLQALLRPMAELEREMQALYEWLAECFAADREAARIFFRLALEERRHAATVEHLRRLARQNPKLFTRVDASLEELQQAMGACRALRRNGAPPTLAAALRAAYRLECTAAESHYRQEVAAAVPEVAELVGALAGGDRLHGEALRRLAAARGLSLEAPPGRPWGSMAG